MSMIKIHGKEYSEVKDRLVKFWGDHPDWSLITTLESSASEAKERVLFRASLISPDEKQIVEGWAYEERTQKSTEVNSTSWVENAETSAIGRALANFGLQGSSERPSAEEMGKVERMKANVIPAANRETGESAPTISARDRLKNRFQGDTPKKVILEKYESLKEKLGHDQFFQQALANRDVSSIDELKTKVSLQELAESLVEFEKAADKLLSDAAGIPYDAKMKDVPEEKRDEVQEKLKKISLIM